MFDDDVVHAGCRWSAGETAQDEIPVGVGQILIKQALKRSASPRHELCVGHRREVGKDSNVLDGRAVGHVSKLAGHTDGLGPVSGERHG